MEIVTISPKFQIVIPAALRKSLHLKQGQQLMLTEKDGNLEVRPLRPMEEYEGSLKGLTNDFEREPDRL